ncbi:hypothetical protein FTO70_08295 [Methanosarcina sp. KYL-1]|uniref:hypothetical protein n=1 Tax=Methanosarcina sp. KYL-1 TaxID=2602068 RepID=UPI0021015C8E|nr:hypothetical protein [Methanosarcina sp. KYL-1]MCQ1535678.1 hypothetical protein [Methanosarcina sp. KYL-1]
MAKPRIPVSACEAPVRSVIEEWHNLIGTFRGWASDVYGGQQARMANLKPLLFCFSTKCYS